MAEVSRPDSVCSPPRTDGVSINKLFPGNCLGQKNMVPPESRNKTSLLAGKVRQCSRAQVKRMPYRCRWFYGSNDSWDVKQHQNRACL